MKTNAAVKRQLRTLLSAKILGISKSSSDRYDRGSLIEQLANDEKVTSSLKDLFTVLNEACPAMQNTYTNDPAMGDVWYVARHFDEVDQEKKAGLQNFLTSLLSSRPFTQQGSSTRVNKQRLFQKYRMFSSPGSFKEKKPMQAGQGYQTEPVPSDTQSRHETQKAGSALIVSNLSRAQGKGMLESSANPDAFMMNDAFPKVTSIQDAMTDISNAQPTGDLKRKTIMKGHSAETDTRIIRRQPTRKTAGYRTPYSYLPPVPRYATSTEDRRSRMEAMVEAADSQNTTGRGNVTGAGQAMISNIAYQNTGQGTGGKSVMGGPPGTNWQYDPDVGSGRVFSIDEEKGRTDGVYVASTGSTGAPASSEVDEKGFNPGAEYFADIVTKGKAAFEAFKKEGGGDSKGDPDASLVETGTGTKNVDDAAQEAYGSADEWEKMWDEIPKLAKRPGGKLVAKFFANLFKIPDKGIKFLARLFKGSKVQDPWDVYEKYKEVTENGTKLDINPAELMTSQGLMSNTDSNGGGKGKKMHLQQVNMSSHGGLTPAQRENFQSRIAELEQKKSRAGHITGSGDNNVDNQFGRTDDSTWGLLWNAAKSVFDVQGKKVNQAVGGLTAGEQAELERLQRAVAEDQEQSTSVSTGTEDTAQDKIESLKQRADTTTSSTNLVETTSTTSVKGDDDDVDAEMAAAGVGGSPPATPSKGGDSDASTPSSEERKKKKVKVDDPHIASPMKPLAGNKFKKFYGLAKTEFERIRKEEQELDAKIKDSKKYNEDSIKEFKVERARLKGELKEIRGQVKEMVKGHVNERKGLENEIHVAETDWKGLSQDAKKAQKAYDEEIASALQRWRNKKSGSKYKKGTPEYVKAEKKELKDIKNRTKTVKLKEKAETAATRASDAELRLRNLGNDFASLAREYSEGVAYDKESEIGKYARDQFYAEYGAGEEGDIDIDDEDETEAKTSTSASAGIGTGAPAFSGFVPSGTSSTSQAAPTKEVPLDNGASPSTVPVSREAGGPGNANQPTVDVEPPYKGAKDGIYTPNPATVNDPAKSGIPNGTTADPTKPNARGEGGEGGIQTNYRFTESYIPYLRLFMPEGNANVVTEINENPQAKQMNRQVWYSFDNYDWEANEEEDNPLRLYNMVDEARRFHGQLDKEELMPQMASEAIQESYNRFPKEIFRFPSTCAQEANSIVLDVRGGGPQVPQTVDETETSFHDVYMKPWIEIPESSPWKRFTQVEGTQISDSQIRDPSHLHTNTAYEERDENMFIYTTDM